MSSTKWQRLLAPPLFVGLVVAASNACSSSSSGGNGATNDGGTPVSDAGLSVRHPDSALPTGTVGDDAGGNTEAGAAAPFDGTTGKPCSSNADCKGSAADAPGINVCSNTYSNRFTVDTVQVQLWPTPLCMLPLPQQGGNCDPGPTGGVQFCDSPNNLDPTSPGVCLPVPGLSGTNGGLCLPSCTFDLSGAAATGCPGHDTCVPFTFLLNPNDNSILGLGFCQGTCETDADCSALGAGWGCQSDLGFCTLKKKTRTKALGAACTDVSASGGSTDNTLGNCNCFTNLQATSGYCTSACVVGGAPCANGGVCDALEPTSLTFTGAAPDGSDLVIPGPATPTPGLSGVCMDPCTLPDSGTAPPASDAGAGDAGEGGLAPGQCPPNVSTCVGGTVGGPDCQPNP